jgi:hypothetical protein
VFERLVQASLKLKASKCQLFQPEVHFLGHILSRTGISADPEKVRVVANWPRPRNFHEARSFLGLSGYYRKFIAGYADIAKPLHMLTIKGQPFVWMDSQEDALRKLKDKLMAATILSSPRDEGDYVLDTDATQTGLGAVLQQLQDGDLKVIAYASRCLSRSEQNYNTTRRELLAIIYGLKQFRQFLLGRHFLLRVNHSALTFLRKTPELIGQAPRWLEYIEEYDFDIIHWFGTSHENWDALSRIPCGTNEDNGSDVAVKQCYRMHEPQVQTTVTEMALTPEIIVAEQRKDAALKPIIEALLKSDARPPWRSVQSESEETRALWA